MIYTLAKEFALSVKQQLEPRCERIEIAGSVRRGEQDCGDIELVAMPKKFSLPPEFGAKKIFVTEVDAWVDQMVNSRQIELLLNGQKQKKFWILRSGVHVIKVDLFLVTPPAQWGVIYLIRTGPNKSYNNFSQWMVTNRNKGGALPDGWRVENGTIIYQSGETLDVPDEKNFFSFCGLDYVEPKDRKAKWKHA